MMIIMSINRPAYSTLLSVQLPILARGEGVQLSWTQTTGFHANEDIWQLDNIALLSSYEIDSPLLSSFSGIEQSSSVMFYSGGIIEVYSSVILHQIIMTYSSHVIMNILATLT